MKLFIQINISFAFAPSYVRAVPRRSRPIYDPLASEKVGNGMVSTTGTVLILPEYNCIEAPSGRCTYHIKGLYTGNRFPNIGTKACLRNDGFRNKNRNSSTIDKPWRPEPEWARAAIDLPCNYTPLSYSLGTRTPV